MVSKKTKVLNCLKFNPGKKMTAEELSALTGIRKRYVSLILSFWKRKGVLRYEEPYWNYVPDKSQAILTSFIENKEVKDGNKPR